MSSPNSFIELIEDGWARLDAAAGSLSQDQLSRTGSDGWAVKDHLIHVAAWELSLLALLEGANRAEAMGARGLEETDEINNAVWLAHRSLTPEHALRHFKGAHARLMAALERISDADLERSYNHYQPDDPKPSPAGERPVGDWVAGNTYEHYAEHVDWMNQLLSDSSAAR